MVQMARRTVNEIDSALLPIRFVLHDRDSKVLHFLSRHASIGPHSTSQPASPQPEPECVRGTLGTLHQKRVSSKLILFGEASLRRTICKPLGRVTPDSDSRALFGLARSALWKLSSLRAFSINSLSRTVR